MASLSTHTSRDVQRETSHAGRIFQVSNCSFNTSECEGQLKRLISTSESLKSKSRLKSKLNLLHELECIRYMPLNLAYEEYLGKLPKEFHPVYTTANMALKTFVDSLLNESSGLPVVIITPLDSRRYIILLDQAGSENNLKTFKLIDELLCTGLSEKEAALHSISEYFPVLKELFGSTRERAIAITLLALDNSATSMRWNLGIREDIVLMVKRMVMEFCETLDAEEKIAVDTAKESWTNTINQVESMLKEEEKFLKEKGGRVHISVKEDVEQNVINRKERLSKLKKDPKQYVKRLVKVEMKKWRNKLFSTKGKGKGMYKIDRGAEQAVYEALQEQLVAHKTRTGAPLLEKRIHRREMRKIANEWLKKNGKRLVKSYETVRSWGRPKNKRSIQSLQHRGKGLFSHRKPQKKFTEAHVNIHYNRTHIKHYTRNLFSNRTKAKYKLYSVRRCFDDKAYLRCGTSEGFSRPKHLPLLLNEEQPELPSYDFPEKAGYIAPGVNLIINDMEEIEKDGRDVFATKDVTISVTCKPKISYSSSSTNWANDMYRDRLEFPEEHEVPKSGIEQYSRETKTYLVFLKDSLTQFKIMNLKEDYIRCIEGGEHLEREKLRLSVLIVRLLYVSFELGGTAFPAIHDISERCRELALALQTCEYKISSSVSANECEVLYDNLNGPIVDLLAEIAPLTPEHRPIDIQTTDAGPGVGTSERIVRLRLTESFIINDLDLQARFHYAPRDSKSHKVEQVMSALNEAAGDGRFIDTERRSVLETCTEENLLQMNVEDFQKEQEKDDVRFGYQCAKKLSDRYNGAACMFTTIHSRVADKTELFQMFFFDEKYMYKCSSASSAKRLNQCAGRFYFKFLCDTFEKHYIRHNNGVEGIRINEQFRCPDIVKRIPPPIPNYSATEIDGSMHYYRHNPDPLPSEYGDLMKGSLDEFCPIVQLNTYIDSKGEPDVVVNQLQNIVTVKDKNDTWRKISDGLETFIDIYTGKDLSSVVEKEAEKIYIRKLRKNSKKLSKLSLSAEELFSITTGSLKIKVTRKRFIDPLPWNGTVLGSNAEMINTCTVDNMLFAFHVLQTYREDVKQIMRDSSDPIMRLICDIHVLFDDRKFAEGKFKWVKQFPHTNKQGRWNLWGAEEDFAFGKLDCGTTYTLTCSEKEYCSQPVRIMTSRVICFSYDGRDLLEGIKMWFNNHNRQVRCGSMQNNGLGRCQGHRLHSPRQFVNSPPLLLPLDISSATWTKMPPSLEVANEQYSLLAITYGNGGHFNSSITIQGSWYLYDGLREHLQPGSGLKKQLQPHSMPGYRQSYALYARVN